jgi:hypothetical protein
MATQGWRKAHLSIFASSSGVDSEYGAAAERKTPAAVSSNQITSNAVGPNGRASSGLRPSPNRVPNHHASPIRGASPSPGLSTRHHRPVKRA